MPDDPINGHKNCSERGQLPVYCTLSCDDGFAFAYQPMQDYFCPVNESIFEAEVGDYHYYDYPDGVIDASDYVELIMAGTPSFLKVTFKELKLV